ncbi:hypothetical protein AA23498_3468 [Acetobacter nitrogenifigens DSM 23921 = NBRC 105050]|uniref:hypothetical protein n=1 Tax=Acetobacter nitrogenifigens TaxID=285268 RepID=UPI0003FB625F|nr:hypothetical protein [Acetobacter nitrogenifigens]GBQ99424.1 hypothetical protein AA23498_3468 [Acetobacter nitrogenifigens DSM 23921 = NBRC 105050]
MTSSFAMPFTSDAGAPANAIVATLIPEDRRMRFLPRAFPTAIRGRPGMMWCEGAVTLSEA